MVFYLVFLAKKLSQLKMIIKLAQRVYLLYNPLLEFSFVYQYKIFNVGRSKTKPKSHRILKFIKLNDSILDKKW